MKSFDRILKTLQHRLGLEPSSHELHHLPRLRSRLDVGDNSQDLLPLAHRHLQEQAGVAGKGFGYSSSAADIDEDGKPELAIGCYDCHDGPTDDDPNFNQPPTVQGTSASTPAGVPVVV